jgi:large subunit ribosomal protein L32
MSRGILFFLFLFFTIPMLYYFYMAPLPKRKHSTQRKGKRMVNRIEKLSNLITCPSCGKKKLPHRVCKYCNK